MSVRSPPARVSLAAHFPNEPPSPSRVFEWLCLCAARRAQRRALAELDDRLLADIGVSRAEAARECAKPFWR